MTILHVIEKKEAIFADRFLIFYSCNLEISDSQGQDFLWKFRKKLKKKKKNWKKSYIYFQLKRHLTFSYKHHVLEKKRSEWEGPPASLIKKSKRLFSRLINELRPGHLFPIFQIEKKQKLSSFSVTLVDLQFAYLECLMIEVSKSKTPNS